MTISTPQQARILDGKRIAEELLDGLKARVDARVAAGKARPGLAVVLVGNDPASSVYVRNKRRAAEKVGIRAIDYDLPAETSDEELLALVDRLNADPQVHGILVQLPLPDRRDATRLIHRIDPRLEPVQQLLGDAFAIEDPGLPGRGDRHAVSEAAALESGQALSPEAQAGHSANTTPFQ
jgi:hypothetical protein